MRRRVFVSLLLAVLVFAPQLQAEPGTWNPNCRQGETFTRVITWEDNAPQAANRDHAEIA